LRVNHTHSHSPPDPDGHDYALLNSTSNHTSLASSRHGSVHRTDQNGDRTKCRAGQIIGEF